MCAQLHRLFAPAVLAALAFLTACSPAGTGASEAPAVCEDTAPTVHLIVGVAGGDLQPAVRQHALIVLGTQVKDLVGSAGGSPTVLISVYPLSSSPFDQH